VWISHEFSDLALVPEKRDLFFFSCCVGAPFSFGGILEFIFVSFADMTDAERLLEAQVTIDSLWKIVNEQQHQIKMLGQKLQDLEATFQSSHHSEGQGSRDEFGRGDRVQIHGLVNDTAFNSQCGQLQDFFYIHIFLA
jgi:hypothetical protein